MIAAWVTRSQSDSGQCLSSVIVRRGKTSRRCGPNGSNRQRFGKKMRMHRPRVQHPEVVRLEKRVDDHLPVHASHQRAPRVVHVAFEPDRRRAPERARPGSRSGSSAGDGSSADQSMPPHSNAGSSTRFRSESSTPAKLLAVRHPHEAPPAVVGPPVVRTDEPPPAVPVTGNATLRAAMPAYIQERAEHVRHRRARAAPVSPSRRPSA